MRFGLVFLRFTQDAAFGCMQVYIFVSHNAKCTILAQHCNASQCVILNLQLHPNALQNELHVFRMHCNASKAGKRETSTCNGKKVAQQECELFQTSFFRMRGWLELLRQKKFLSTSSLSKSFSFFLMQSWASCKYVSATLECIGVEQILNAVFVLHAKCKYS